MIAALIAALIAAILITACLFSSKGGCLRGYEAGEYLDAQLHAAGCAKVYSEKISGIRSSRPKLAKVLKRLGDGDVLIGLASGR